jgi:ankyrin repeat protein
MNRALAFATALVLSATVAVAADPPLVQAVKTGDAAAVRTLLTGKADANLASVDGTTALQWAVQRDAVAIVDQLIAAGAKVDAANRYGSTPLALACTNGNAAIVQRLLKGGANANATLPGGETALMTAARTGKVDVMKALLAYGADPNAREGVRGQTALMWAAAENNADAVKTLVEAGAEISARSGVAAARPAGAPAGGQQSGGVFSGAVGSAAQANAAAARPSFTAFLFAAQLGQWEAGRVLLDAGVDPNQSMPDGTSALVLAAQNGQWQFAGHLLDWGAEPDASRQGFTALHQVARIRRTNIGFLPPPVGKGNVSSLDLVQKLIVYGADVNARMTRDFRDGYRNRLNRVGATPFLLAAKNVDTELMKLLIASGADPKAANADKTTPLMVAAGLDLWNPGEDGGSSPDQEPEALEAVKMLVALGNDVNALNDRGETAMHGAAYRGAMTIVQYLADQGARLDVRSKQGWTPWTIANGVFYTLFFKEQRPTADYLGKLMAERGISTEGMADEGRTCFDCGRNNRVARDADGNRIAQPAPDAVPRQGATETSPVKKQD